MVRNLINQKEKLVVFPGIFWMGKYTHTPDRLPQHPWRREGIEIRSPLHLHVYHLSHIREHLIEVRAKRPPVAEVSSGKHRE